MIVSHDIQKVRDIIRQQKNRGKTIGFVPTMGALHKGHTSLIRRSAEENDYTVISIFVNPLQFGPNEDFNHYPRTPDEDIEKAKAFHTDLIFHPSAREILGTNMLTFVNIEKLQDNLCGRKRPGHFRGVCTIVTKLFNIITPHRAYFGQKDIQQLFIIKKMVQDLNFSIEIIACPIVREKDGLAISSRNVYLSNEERKDAAVLNQALKQAVKKIEKGETSASVIIDHIKNIIQQKASAKIDYVSIVDKDMKDVHKIKKGDVIALAVYIGKTRLIDNHIVGDRITF